MPHVFATSRVQRRANHRAPHDAFLWQWLAEGMAARAKTVKRAFQQVRLLAPTPMIAKQLQQHLQLARPDWAFAQADEDNTASDAIIVMGLPTILDDVPQQLQEWQQQLPADGWFLCGFYGGTTLAELRTALLQAEAALQGGAAARVAPMIDPTSASMLLQRAGFGLPVVDQELLRTSYSDVLKLVQDIRQANAHAVLQQVQPWPRALLPVLQARYAEQFADARGRLLASWQALYLSGWKN